jgi:methionyl-tRNA formyltransferase
MDSGLDTGDIVYRKELPVAENDTADTLYRKLKRLELDVFEAAWPQLLSRQVTRIAQNPESGTFHKRQDLFREEVQKIDLDKETTARELLKRLRALTSDRVNEAAYIELDGKKHRVRVTITPDESPLATPIKQANELQFVEAARKVS